jgi:hypothetical protein
MRAACDHDQLRMRSDPVPVHLRLVNVFNVELARQYALASPSNG